MEGRVKTIGACFRTRKLRALPKTATIHQLAYFSLFNRFTKLGPVATQTHYAVPARLIADFIGREDVLSDIQCAFGTISKITTPTVILTGMGGQRKTQVSFKHCRRAFDPKRVTSVFCADATSQNSSTHFAQGSQP